MKMSKVMETLGLLLKELNEKQLIDSLPVFSRLVSEIISDIKMSKDYDSVVMLFDLLVAISWPLSTLSVKYSRELPNDLMELLKIQGFLYPDQHGLYKESRERIYQGIRTGELFKHQF